MNILVTGGAGYIGSMLVPELLQRNHTITVLDNFRYHQTSLMDLCHHKHLKIIRGDSRDRELIKKLIKDQDCIFPLACLTGAPICDKYPREAKEINLDAIQILLELKSPSQRVILPNTNSGYGIGEKDIYCSEQTPLKPVSLYGRLKVEAETILLSHENTISFRLATVFGMSPRMRLDLLVNEFVYRAVKDGFIVLFEAHFKRNYIHIRDVVKAFLHGLEHFEEMKGQVYNVGLSNTNLSKLELCQTIQKYVPKFVFVEQKIGEDPDQRNYIVSNEKIEKTDYKPNYSLDDGIQELIQGYEILATPYFRNA